MEGVCEGNATAREACPLKHLTCRRNCEWNEWTDNWSECSVTCEQGVKERNRTVKSEAELGGANCSAKDATQHVTCNLDRKCPSK